MNNIEPLAHCQRGKTQNNIEKRYMGVMAHDWTCMDREGASYAAARAATFPLALIISLRFLPVLVLFDFSLALALATVVFLIFFFCATSVSFKTADKANWDSGFLYK
jgi:hypothetical protein